MCFCFFSHLITERRREKMSFRRFGLNVSSLISHTRCNCALKELHFFSLQSPKARVSTNPSTAFIWMLKQMFFFFLKLKKSVSLIFFFLFLFHASSGGCAKDLDPPHPLLLNLCLLALAVLLKSWQCDLLPEQKWLRALCANTFGEDATFWKALAVSSLNTHLTPDLFVVVIHLRTCSDARSHNK